MEASLLQHRLKSEEAEQKYEDIEKQILGIKADKKAAQDQISRLRRKAEVLGKKLQKVDPDEMTFGNRLGNSIRDLPVLDFLAPYYKIDQIVIKDITEDLNFANVPKVDRCTTCHMGIATPGYEDAPQPHTTHPDLELYLLSESPHPKESLVARVVIPAGAEVQILLIPLILPGMKNRPRSGKRSMAGMNFTTGIHPCFQFNTPKQAASNVTIKRYIWKVLTNLVWVPI